jgi:hypothetical protein
MSRCTPLHHAMAVVCVLVLSVMLYSAFMLGGFAGPEVIRVAAMPDDTAFTLPAPVH